MNAFEKLISVFSVPLSLLNVFGGIVSGIWLIILGKWGIIGFGIVALFISGIGLGIALMPGMLFSGPAAMLHEKGNKIGFYFFGFLSALYTILVLTIWCILVLYFFVKQANTNSIIPVLLWSYGVAVGPIAWMAQKEMQGGNEYSMIATFFIQVAYLVSIIAILFFRVTLIDVIVLFSLIMLIGLIIQFKIASQAEKEESFY